MTTDCLIIGGGVVGLSVAYELACAGKSVHLVERGQLGREASWAGAGILPAPTSRADVPGWKLLQALGYALHQPWSERLKAETGVDNGYRKCGGIHLARSAGEAAALRADMAELSADGVRVEALDAENLLRELEPHLLFARQKPSDVHAAFHLPDEAQIRNPEHLRALIAACRLHHVTFHEETAAESFTLADDCITNVNTSRGIHYAGTFIITAGAWSEALFQSLGLTLSLYPVRGQMLLYRGERPPVSHIINEGPRYIVPRSDGRVLVGSTEEDVGFDKLTTSQGIAELRSFAEELLPALRNAELEKTWAGLRPHAVDGFPYLGRVPHLQNCFVAAGHYRAGLSTSTATAVLVRQMVEAAATEIDLGEFRLDR